MAEQPTSHGAASRARATPLAPTGPARPIKVPAPTTESAPRTSTHPSQTSGSTTTPGAEPPAPIFIRARPPVPVEVPPPTVDRDYSAVLPGPLYAPRPPSRSRRSVLLATLGWLALAAAVVTSVVFAFAGPEADQTASGGVVATSTPQATVPSGAATPQPGTGSLAPPVVLPPAAVTPLNPPGGGTGAVAPGLTVAAAVLSGDVVEVSESVYWPDGAPEEIVLSLPPLGLNGVPSDVAPSVRALQVSVDGTPVIPTSGEEPNTWTVVPATGSDPERMDVRYLVDFALVRSAPPSQPGRALAVVAPLSQDTVGDLPVRVSMAGLGVLGLSCATSPQEPPALCGRVDGARWTATPAAGAPAVVVAQLDLSPVG